MIEIANSTLASDLDNKKKIYAAEGIKEYWVADLGDRQVFIFHHPVNGQYTRDQVCTDGAISPKAFPNLEFSLKDLFQW